MHSISPTTSTTQSTTIEDNKTFFKNKTGIKSIVANEILKLKSDLDQLLKFNENLLHFDSSIMKNAAKNKVEKFMKKLSTTIENQSSDDTIENTDKMEAASNILRYNEVHSFIFLYFKLKYTTQVQYYKDI